LEEIGEAVVPVFSLGLVEMVDDGGVNEVALLLFSLSSSEFGGDGNEEDENGRNPCIIVFV